MSLPTSLASLSIGRAAAKEHTSTSYTPHLPHLVHGQHQRHHGCSRRHAGCSAVLDTSTLPDARFTRAHLTQWLTDRGARFTLERSPSASVNPSLEAVERAQNAIVKTLVFVVKAESVIVVTNGDARVDIASLAALLRTSRSQVRMATPGEALAWTGFAPGSIPPFAHRVRSRYVFVDVDVRRAVPPGEMVYVGGGDPHHDVALEPGELLRVLGHGDASCAEVDIKVRETPATLPLPLTLPPPLSPAMDGASTTPPLPTRDSIHLYGDDGKEVTVCGTISVVRRVARHLLFANIIVDGDGDDDTAPRASTSPFPSPLSGQLIAGHTLVRRYGPASVGRLLTSIKVR